MAWLVAIYNVFCVIAVGVLLLFGLFAVYEWWSARNAEFKVGQDPDYPNTWAIFRNGYRFDYHFDDKETAEWRVRYYNSDVFAPTYGGPKRKAVR